MNVDHTPLTRVTETPEAGRTRRGNAAALRILAAAALLGLLGDLLLRPGPRGLGFALWIVGFTMAAIALGRWTRPPGDAWKWTLPMLVFAALVVWRDSPTLRALNLFAMGTLLALTLLRAQGIGVRRAGMANFLAGMLGLIACAVAGALDLFLRDVFPREGAWRHASGAARGVVLALPLLLLFGSLLASADASFERLLQVFRLDVPLLLSHLLLAAGIAWGVTGLFLGVLVEEGGWIRGVERPKILALGIVEIGTALALLDALFAAFVTTQLPYLFGGEEARAALGYAEYARRGFFELVAVAGLVLPLLLGAHWLLRQGPPLHERIFRALAGLQVLLLFVIVASALHRMRLYQSEYGWTELRLYTTAFMGWLAAVFVWFAATVLRGRRERFAFGALAAGWAGIVVLHALNPDAMIVRVNAARSGGAERFDVGYATSLSADAVPALLAVLPTLAPAERCGAASRILKRWTRTEGADWRVWNGGRARAIREVRRRRAELREVACPRAERGTGMVPTPAPGRRVLRTGTPAPG